MKTRKITSGLFALILVVSLAGCSSKKARDASPDNTLIVTRDNFTRAETDMYFTGMVQDGKFGTILHSREIAPVDNQPVIRYNRDVLVSSGLFDLDAGPVTITLPDPGKRFLSILAINEDHYNPLARFGGGVYTLTKENVGTRYMAIAHALRDSVKVSHPVALVSSNRRNGTRQAAGISTTRSCWKEKT